MIKNQISIGIPTHNRPKEIQRLQRYYKDFPVIIGDSSVGEKQGIQLPSNIFLYEKLLIIVENIETKYTLLTADDDFVCIFSIYQAVRFLENNPAFAAVGGDVVSFDSFFNLSPVYEFHRSNITEKKEERVLNQLEYYFPILWNIFPTKVLKKTLSTVIENSNDVIFSEILFTLLILLEGKYHKMDDFFNVRQSHPLQNRPSMKSYKKEGTHQNRYNNFYNCLISHLGDEYDQQLTNSWNQYIKYWKQKNLFYRVFNKISRSIFGSSPAWNEYFTRMRSEIKKSSCFLVIKEILENDSKNDLIGGNGIV